MKLTVTIVLFAFVAVARSAVVEFGKCTDIHTLSKVDKEKVLGTWYTVRSNDEDEDLICTKDVLDSWSGNILNGETYGVFKETKAKFQTPLSVEYEETPNSAVFHVQYTLGETTIKSQMELIDTDYENYMITVTCLDNKPTIWVDTRSQTPSAEVLDKVNDVFKKYHFNYVFHDISQDC